MVLAATGSKKIETGLWTSDFSAHEGEGRRLVRGMGSSVLIDERTGIVMKTYKPGRLIRAMYWLAFQAPFPYESKPDALRAAELRREIADLVLEYEMMPGLVAQAYEAEETTPGIATEFVAGTAPRDARKAKGFLKYVTSSFLRAGLPTWQVAPWQPRAAGNLIEGGDWDYRIIDLESNLVSPFIPLTQLGEVLEQGLWPTFDDINVKRLLAYLRKHHKTLVQRLGAARAARLDEAAAQYDFYARRWHDSEPRLISRTLKYAYKTVTFPVSIPGRVRSLIHRLRSAGKRARVDFFETIERRHDAGELTVSEVVAAVAAAQEPVNAIAIYHAGVSAALASGLPQPLAAAVRGGYRLALRARAEVLWLMGRRTDASLGRRAHALRANHQSLSAH